MSDREVKFFWALIAGVFVTCLTSSAFASGFGGIPQVSVLAGMVKDTIQGPVAATFFTAGVVKMGQGVYRAGGIQGLADGGVGIAGAGALMFGAPWLAGQLGGSGALIS